MRVCACVFVCVRYFYVVCLLVCVCIGTDWEHTHTFYNEWIILKVLSSSDLNIEHFICIDA